MPATWMARTPTQATWATTSAATSPGNWLTCLTTVATTASGTIFMPTNIFVDHDYWERQLQAQGWRVERCPRQVTISRRTLSPEQVVAAEQVEAARAAAYSERKAQQLAASKRAEELLLEHLTSAQQDTYKRNKWFVVLGGKSGTKYRIRDSGSFVGNVDVMDGERVTHRLCAHIPTDQVPTCDNILAQKMMLEYDEDVFIKKANRHAVA